MRNTVVFVITIALYLGGVSYAEPAMVDNQWQKKETGSNVEAWFKEIGGIGGQATLYYIRHQSEITYTVIRPCLEGGAQVLIWENMSAVARGVDCSGSPVREDTILWLEVFRPLPRMFAPA